MIDYHAAWIAILGERTPEEVRTEFADDIARVGTRRFLTACIKEARSQGCGLFTPDPTLRRNAAVERFKDAAVAAIDGAAT